MPADFAAADGDAFSDAKRKSGDASGNDDEVEHVHEFTKVAIEFLEMRMCRL